MSEVVDRYGLVEDVLHVLAEGFLIWDCSDAFPHFIQDVLGDVVLYCIGCEVLFVSDVAHVVDVLSVTRALQR